MQETEVVSANAFPADKQAAKGLVPGVGALNDPLARLTLNAPSHPMPTQPLNDAETATFA